MAETAVRTPARVPGTNAKNSGRSKLDPNYYYCLAEPEMPDSYIATMEDALSRPSPTRVGENMYEVVPDDQVPFPIHKRQKLLRCRVEDKDIENEQSAMSPVGQIDPEVAARRAYAYAGGDFEEEPIDPKVVPGFKGGKRPLDQIGVGRPDEYGRTRQDWLELARTNGFKPEGKKK